MKRLLFLLLLGTTFFSYGQKLKFKPAIGFNVNTQKAPYTFNNKTKIGYDFGILAERNFNHNLSVEFGFLISQTNFSLNRTRNYRDSSWNLILYDIHENIKVKFIKFPIIINIKQNRKNPFSLGVGFVVKSNINSITKSYKVINPGTTFSYNYQFQTNNRSLGIGFQNALKKEFTCSNKNFAIGFYFDTDLSTWFYSDRAWDIPRDEGFKTRANNFSFLISMAL